MNFWHSRRTPLRFAMLMAFSVFVCATALAQGMSGTYQGDGLTLVLKPIARGSNRYTGIVSLGTQKFLAKGQLSTTQLSGSFISNGQTFPFSLRRVGNSATFVTGNTVYHLKAQSGLVNPLARPLRNPLAQRPVAVVNSTTKAGTLGLTAKMDEAGQMRVFTLVEGGPAQRAGLQRGDMIRSMAGEPIRTNDQIEALMRGPVGSSVPMVLVRETEAGGTQMFNATVVRALLPIAGAKARAKPKSRRR